MAANPLDVISEDHLRERQICAAIDGLAMAAFPDRQAAQTVLRFLDGELNVHLRDEVEDLFPLLARRCTAEDSIESTIGRIRSDQDEVIRLLPEVRAVLAGCLVSGPGLSVEDRALLTLFAGRVRRHLVAENAILIPIARARLTRSDLRVLAKRMQVRRGLSSIQETGNAE
ncbi:hemerythrin domain-containing protein [Tabrizicola sp.]|uniref:hemerythrin domain-containing protein n=1 Tax=Tabrizicola sp. TaxID=2005166 RepID=UPI00262F4AF7|nr:hemerythrin domain-containing protein [Tabrizicola sp.]MDM7930650.1 hemerythrin domain-containing protein [Tabrizicola sp.]